MHIEVKHDNHIKGSEGLSTYVQSVVEHALDHVRDRVTTVEVHLSDENADKQGDHDKRCAIEARLQGLKPFGVTHMADSVDEAVEGAADKLKRSLESVVGKLLDRKLNDRR